MAKAMTSNAYFGLRSVFEAEGFLPEDQGPMAELVIDIWEASKRNGCLEVLLIEDRWKPAVGPIVRKVCDLYGDDPVAKEVAIQTWPKRRHYDLPAPPVPEEVRLGRKRAARRKWLKKQGLPCAAMHLADPLQPAPWDAEYQVCMGRLLERRDEQNQEEAIEAFNGELPAVEKLPQFMAAWHASGEDPSLVLDYFDKIKRGESVPHRMAQANWTWTERDDNAYERMEQRDAEAWAQQQNRRVKRRALETDAKMRGMDLDWRKKKRQPVALPEMAESEPAASGGVELVRSESNSTPVGADAESSPSLRSGAGVGGDGRGGATRDDSAGARSRKRRENAAATCECTSASVGADTEPAVALHCGCEGDARSDVEGAGDAQHAMTGEPARVEPVRSDRNSSSGRTAESPVITHRAGGCDTAAREGDGSRVADDQRQPCEPPRVAGVASDGNSSSQRTAESRVVTDRAGDGAVAVHEHGDAGPAVVSESVDPLSRERRGNAVAPCRSQARVARKDKQRAYRKAMAKREAQRHEARAVVQRVEAARVGLAAGGYANRALGAMGLVLPHHILIAIRYNSGLMNSAFQQCINPDCNATFSVEETHVACPTCKARGVNSLLDIRYDWDKLQLPNSLAEFEKRWSSRKAADASGVWRFRDLFPFFRNEDDIVTIGEGKTILQDATLLASHLGFTPGQLHLQYEGLNPSGSFKDNGMTAAFTHARMVGAKRVACASTGNTSASLAMYASLAQMKSLVFIGSGKIAYGKLSQALDYGARTLQLQGDFDACLRRVRQISTEMTELGIYLMNSVNPFRLEGQKSIMLRVLEALAWETPDWIVVPGGNLGNTSAFGKAFSELHSLGLINKIPRLAVIQAQGANPLFELVNEHGLTWNDGRWDQVVSQKYYQQLDASDIHAHTVASAIEIGRPVNLPKALRSLETMNGVVRQVDDETILEFKALVGKFGFGCEPASAASVAGAKQLMSEGVIGKGDKVVCILTGHELKDPDATVRYHTGIDMKAIQDKAPRQAPHGKVANLPVPVPDDLQAIVDAIKAG